MTRLSVNLNKVALLRNARTLGIPSVVRAAVTALDAGAHGITVHPRPDQRHIRVDDLRDLSQLLAGRRDVEFNIEGNPFHGLVEIARTFRPQQCTLVPDETSAATSDHGWDLKRDGERLRPIVRELQALGIRVSLFMDALSEVMPAVRDLGADRVELYTEPYARAFSVGNIEHLEFALSGFAAAARAAQKAGLGVNAGHDLNQANLAHFLTAVPGVLEVSIGHALIADALEHGLAQTVRDYLAVIARVPVAA